MKKLFLTASFLTVSLAFGSKPASDKPVVSSTHAMVQPSVKVQTTDNEVPPSERYFNFGQKTQFVMAMREQFTDLNLGLDELSANIEKSSEAVQAEAKPRLAELREKAAQFDKQLTEIASATLPTWNVMKADVETAYAALKDGLAKSKQAVTDKVAP